MHRDVVPSEATSDIYDNMHKMTQSNQINIGLLMDISISHIFCMNTSYFATLALVELQTHVIWKGISPAWDAKYRYSRKSERDEGVGWGVNPSTCSLRYGMLNTGTGAPL